MIGTIVSHYKILGKLGEGGMGIVYKAEDTKLDRLVALKFLPQALTADAEERERFYQEARAASQLLHPNVTAIFEINESDGQIYLAMEYVEGATLKKRIQQESPFPLAKSLDIAIQCCSGIAAAHEKGIVHRDIKSENILLTAKGEVKITDFGLAKLKGATKLTKTGSTLGTASYMSPEQARGEDVDARSDIFSAGVVLYELFTGKLPFRGEHQAAILYSVVNEEPPPLARFNEQLSMELQRIVSKALAKDKEDRYQHADEMLADLKRERKGMEYVKSGMMTAHPPVHQTERVQPGGTRPSGRMKLLIPAAAAVALLIIGAGIYFYLGRPAASPLAGSRDVSKIAVLPFENIGPADKEYFADGLTDEIRTKLSGLSHLAVIARASSMQYKKTAKSIADIGRELSVGYLLQGTIRWEEGGTAAAGSDHLLVNPSLVKISDGTQVWSQSFEVTLSSVFQMQSDIARQVAQALELILNPVEQKTITTKPTNNPEAYDYFLRAQQLLSIPTPAGVGEGIALVEKAVALDPNFVVAHANLCRWYAFEVFEGMRADTLLAHAKKSLERVKASDPNSYSAHWAEGYYYYYGFRNYEQAIEHFTVALNLQPNNDEIISAIGFVKRRQGRFQESRDLLSRSCDLDPQAWRNWFELGYVEFVMRQYHAADEHMSRALLVYGKNSTAIATFHSWVIFSMNGDIKAAYNLFEREAGETHSWMYKMRSFQYHLVGGELDAAKAALSRDALAQPDIDSTAYFSLEGMYHERRGEHRDARAAFDTARVLAERAIAGDPGAFAGHVNLGIALAHLGQKARAIEEGKKGTELMPLERDALDEGPSALLALAEIYAVTGETDAALNTLDRLAGIPSTFSAYFLRDDPDLASLAGLPRFQKLLEKMKNAPPL